MLKMIDLSQYTLIEQLPTNLSVNTQDKTTLARGIVQLLSRGPQDGHVASIGQLLKNKTFICALKKERDAVLLNEVRNEIQKELWRTAVEEVGDIDYKNVKILWLLSTFVMLDPKKGMVVHIPQNINDRWYSVPCKVIPIEITNRITKYGTRVQNRVYSYAMEPIDTVHTAYSGRLNNYVVNKGTSPRTLMGNSTQKVSDYCPFLEVGKTLNLSPLRTYIADNCKKFNTKVTGISLGGSITSLLFDRMPESDSSIEGVSINPAPRLLPFTPQQYGRNKVYFNKKEILQLMGGHYPNNTPVFQLDHEDKRRQLSQVLGGTEQRAMLHVAGPMPGGTWQQLRPAVSLWGKGKRIALTMLTGLIRIIVFSVYPYFTRFSTLLLTFFLVFFLHSGLLQSVLALGRLPALSSLPWLVGVGIVALITATLAYFALTIFFNAVASDGKYLTRLFHTRGAMIRTLSFLVPSVITVLAVCLLHMTPWVTCMLLCLPFVCYMLGYGMQYGYSVMTSSREVRDEEYATFLSEEHDELALNALLSDTLTKKTTDPILSSTSDHVGNTTDSTTESTTESTTTTETLMAA